MKSDTRDTGETRMANRISRRQVLSRAGKVAAAAAMTPALLLSMSAEADAQKPGHTPKAALAYQDKPHGNEECSACRYFIPGSKPGAMGHCVIVAGDISPHGWCQAWAS